MPQTSSAKKALRVSIRRRAINDRWRNALRSLQRKFRSAVTAKKTDEAQSVYRELQSTLDRMARRHIVHRNTAARYKARSAAKLSGVTGSTPTK
ncbi:MAG: 30S ribosomal protein S20 [bacterium]|nr:30S ribosomal protein S20 [bacterium]